MGPGRQSRMAHPGHAEHRSGADALQRPLRSRFRARLTAGVDMTSDVKGWPPIFYIFFIPSTFVSGRDGARKTRRLILLLSVDWLPPSLRPSGAGLALGTRVCFSLFTPSRATPNRGCVSSDGRRFPRSRILQQSGRRRRSFYPDNGLTCDGKVDRFLVRSGSWRKGC
jgi:hypothetical protein